MKRFELGRDIKFPELNFRSQVATGGGIGVAFVQAPDALGFMAWLFGDQIVARLESEIDELADDEGTMTAQQKAEK